ncbi:MAG: hypothetical protein KF906_09310 [Actinobacteria bacterium]|nr:hypothetical protein [Actinomycetota bacterium]
MGTSDHRFTSGLKAGTYLDDPLIGWTSADGQAEAWVADRLVDRLRLLGAAYELHLVPLLPARDETVTLELNAAQVRNLRDEIEWLADLVSDAALVQVATTILPVLRTAERGSGLRVD